MPRSIFITGANGFLGSCLAEKFLSQGFLVYGAVRKGSDLSRLGKVLEKIHLVKTDEIDLEYFFKTQRVDFVVHTATVYGRNGESLKEMQAANTLLPKKLWELVKLYGAAAFINTDTFMPANTSMEDRYYNYCKTKKDFLEYAKNNLSPSTKFVNLVVYHMFGPKDNPTKFLPVMISKILKQEKEISLTPGDQKRDFIYIEDVCEAFYKTTENLNNFRDFEEFHIGTGKEYTIKEVLEFIKEYLGSNAFLNWGALPYQKGEVMFSSANMHKNSKLNWQAETEFFEGLRKTIDYYKENRGVTA